VPIAPYLYLALLKRHSEEIPNACSGKSIRSSKTSGVSSKAQEATKLNFELANANKKKTSRIARREEAQRKFQIRAAKKKAKHKGK